MDFLSPKQDPTRSSINLKNLDFPNSKKTRLSQRRRKVDISRCKYAITLVFSQRRKKRRLFRRLRRTLLRWKDISSPPKGFVLDPETRRKTQIFYIALASFWQPLKRSFLFRTRAYDLKVKKKKEVASLIKSLKKSTFVLRIRFGNATCKKNFFE